MRRWAVRPTPLSPIHSATAAPAEAGYGLLQSRRAIPRRNQVTMIHGMIINEELQLLSVLLILAFTIGGIYLIQRYTGV